MQRKTAGAAAPAQSTLQRVNDELLDVQRIMGKNIEQVLDRGENLDGVLTHFLLPSVIFARHYCAVQPWSRGSRACVCVCGVVWCGVVWCGVVWCGVVWCGVVCVCVCVCVWCVCVCVCACAVVCVCVCVCVLCSWTVLCVVRTLSSDACACELTYMHRTTPNVCMPALGSRAAVLKNSSSKYLKDAKQLSWEVMVRKYAPAAVVSFIVLFLFYMRFGLIFI
jgi:hypothetical protein